MMWTVLLMAMPGMLTAAMFVPTPRPAPAPAAELMARTALVRDACQCLCIDGRPETVCQTIADARKQTQVCGDRACSAPATEGQAAPAGSVPLAPPHEDAFDCRATTARPPETASAPQTVKVCRVRPP